MNHYIVEQPDGRFAVFSTGSNQFIVWNGTEEDIVEWLAQDAAASMRHQARHEFGKRRANRFTPWWAPQSWDELLQLDRQFGGDYSRRAMTQHTWHVEVP